MYGKPCPQKDDATQIVEKMIAADVIVMATPVYFLYHVRTDEDYDRPLLCTLYGNNQQGILFHYAAAENDKAMMERTIDGFRGFLDCPEGPQEKGTVYGIGAWKVGGKLKILPICRKLTRWEKWYNLLKDKIRIQSERLKSQEF